MTPFVLALSLLAAAGEFDDVAVHVDDVSAVVTAAGGRAVVVAGNAAARAPADLLAARLRAKSFVVLGDDAVDVGGAKDDKGIVKAGKDLPVDVVVVVRAYAGGSAPDTLTVIAYDKKAKAKGSWSGQAKTPGERPARTPDPPTSSPSATSPATSPATTPAATTVVVLDPSTSVLERPLIAEVSGRFTTALSNVSRFTVTSAADLQRLMDLEANKQLTGCTSGECLAEFGDALGAERALAWTVSRRDRGGPVVVDFAFYETKTGAALARGSAKASDDDLVSAVGKAVDDMLRGLLRKEGAAANPQAAAQAQYDEEKLAVVERRTQMNWLYPVPLAVEGTQEVELSWPEFYERTGHDDMASDAATDETLRNFVSLPLVVGGVVVAMAGVGGAIAIGATNTALTSRTSNDAAFASAGVGFGVGGALVVAGVVVLVVATDTVPIEEKRRIADEHNDLLRQKLSLPAP